MIGTCVYNFGALGAPPATPAGMAVIHAIEWAALEYGTGWGTNPQPCMAKTVGRWLHAGGVSRGDRFSVGILQETLGNVNKNSQRTPRTQELSHFREAARGRRSLSLSRFGDPGKLWRGTVRPNTEGPELNAVLMDRASGLRRRSVEWLHSPECRSPCAKQGCVACISPTDGQWSPQLVSARRGSGSKSYSSPSPIAASHFRPILPCRESHQSYSHRCILSHGVLTGGYLSCKVIVGNALL